MARFCSCHVVPSAPRAESCGSFTTKANSTRATRNRAAQNNQHDLHPQDTERTLEKLKMNSMPMDTHMEYSAMGMLLLFSGNISAMMVGMMAVCRP